jgi:hypothetical protein
LSTVTPSIRHASIELHRYNIWWEVLERRLLLSASQVDELLDLAIGKPKPDSLRSVTVAPVIVNSAPIQMSQPQVLQTTAPVSKASVSANQNVRSPSDFRYVLRNGSGFDGSTPQPSAVGSGFASNENAIAHWDTVPDQTVTTQLKVGVVAFHINGIDRVDFSANGGAWTSVNQMQLNPETGVVEYFATFRADQFPDGQVEIRAIVYPKAGVPLVLDPIHLVANSGGSIKQIVRYISPNGNDDTGSGSVKNPLATIYQAAMSINAANNGDAGNGIIYLEPGDYSWAGANNRFPNPTTSQSYLTVTAAPGVKTSDVRLTDSSVRDELDARFVHLKNLTIFDAPLQTANDINAQLWLDDCVVEGTGPSDGTLFVTGTQWTGDIFVTDTTIRDTENGIPGAIVRNVTVTDIGSDAFSGSALVVNSSASFEAAPAGSGFHPDVFQNVADVWENLILYDVVATDHVTAQGVAAGLSKIHDMAIVDSNFDNQNPIPTDFQIMEFGGPSQNLYIKNSSFNGASDFRDDGRFDFSATDVVAENTTFNGGPHASTFPVDGVIYR